MTKGNGSAGRQRARGNDQQPAVMISGGAGDGGDSRSLGTLNRNEWAVLKGAGGAGSARDEPATPTRYIPVAALGPDVHIILQKKASC